MTTMTSSSSSSLPQDHHAEEDPTSSIDSCTRPPSRHTAFIADILGDGSRGKMRAGPILEKMDILAGIMASRHVKGAAIATVSFDRVDLTSPVFQGDLIRLEGQIIHVGNSSMMIQISGYRHDGYSGEFIHMACGLVTMVCLNDAGHAQGGLAPIHSDGSSDQRNALARKALASLWAVDQAEVDAMSLGELWSSLRPDPTSKQNAVTMASTVIEAQKAFFPKHENANHTIFGGEILTWMDKMVLYCARNFTRNQNMVTISMDRICFKRPIKVWEQVYMQAKVCRVSSYTLEVEIKVDVVHMTTGVLDRSHTGYFTVLNLGDGNLKRRILTGIDIADADEATLKTLVKAQRRHDFNKRHNSMSGLSRLPIKLMGASSNTSPCPPLPSRL